MTTTTGNAVRMQMDLNALIKARGVEKLAPKFLPLLDPVDHDVEVSGLASTTDVDLSHQKFRGWALCSHAIMLRHEVPPLLYKHDPEPRSSTTRQSQDRRHGASSRKTLPRVLGRCGDKPKGHRKKGTPNRMTRNFRDAMTESAVKHGLDGEGTGGLTGFCQWLLKISRRGLQSSLASSRCK